MYKQQKTKTLSPQTLTVPSSGYQTTTTTTNKGEENGAAGEGKFYLNAENTAGSVTTAIQLQVPVLHPTQAGLTSTSNVKTPFIRDLATNYQTIEAQQKEVASRRHQFELSFKETKPPQPQQPTNVYEIKNSRIIHYPKILFYFAKAINKLTSFVEWKYFLTDMYLKLIHSS